ncbi:MAG: peptidase T [Lactobacillus sp.]|uniref:Peptidase T n=1 Tax=Bombilactobacillus bombi TaxID=1303590 RepID=A0A417ZJT6_9LACO|nr:peptidase T [Bombilactobacillus bombi]MCO6542384.1 peptidase T [Lactobacillus sp.]RHW52178.1 peptidase T [Bombilactobacillus bombi]
MKYKIDNNNLLNNFLIYAKINTRSNPNNSKQIPSTNCQLDLIKILKQQLEELNLQEVKVNPKNSYLTALLPSNTDEARPTIGFIAHLDTADFESENVNPQVHYNYDGKPIKFDNGLELTTTEFPNLKKFIGQTLITTDGKTLLGVDDKAGIASIISAITYLLNHPEISHGPIKIGFGPDEEIGQGAKHFDISDFQADFAYTLDNGDIGDIEYETFNAAQAVITIQGKSVHPGQAKEGGLVNAITIGEKIDSIIPQFERAEFTDNREGYYLMLNFDAKIESAELTYIIRDFDHNNFEKRKQLIRNIVNLLNQQLDRPRINLQIEDEYYNMADIIKKNPYPIDLAKQALINLGITPTIKAFRGGTDGSLITYQGMPTPNLFNGGDNFHGPYEFVTVEAMQAVAATIIEISHISK